MFWFVLCLNLTKLLELDLFYLQKPQYLATIHLNILESRPKEAYLSQKTKKTSFIVLKSLKPTIIGHMKSSAVFKFQFWLNFNPYGTVGNLGTKSRTVESEHECVYITTDPSKMNTGMVRLSDSDIDIYEIVFCFELLQNSFWRISYQSIPKFMEPNEAIKTL